MCCNFGLQVRYGISCNDWKRVMRTVFLVSVCCSNLQPIFHLVRWRSMYWGLLVDVDLA